MGKSRTRGDERDGGNTARRLRSTTGRAAGKAPSPDPLATESSLSGADQLLSDADRGYSQADQVSADSDQRSSDRDQAAADRDHAGRTNLTGDEEHAYQDSRDDREAASGQRLASQADRLNTTHEREATGLYRAVLDAGPNGIVGMDASGLIEYANEHLERMFGYDVGALAGQSIERLIPEGLADRLTHPEGDGTSPSPGETGHGLERMGRRIDGSEFPIEVTLSPIETSDGLRVFATVVDLTARKALESRRLQAQKLESIGRVAAGIAHDFNNMLTAIQGYAAILADDLGPDGRAAIDRDAALANIEAINLTAEHAANLTAQLLAFSRGQVVTPVVLDVNEAIKTIAPLIRQMIGKQVGLRLQLRPSPGLIHVDPTWIDQIVLNLVVNARDAMPDGGKVVIETGRLECAHSEVIADVEVQRGSYVFVAVTDTGLGIDRNSRAHIFEPYFTTKEVGKGTGLGLATTHGIVHQAGGHILVDSEPGQGASFKLLFPRIDRADRTRRRSLAAAS